MDFHHAKYQSSQEWSCLIINNILCILAQKNCQSTACADRMVFLQAQTYCQHWTNLAHALGTDGF
jgi:hypothetical protein